ncbi:MAG TPA: hypothetical protein ENN52_01295 [Methanofollis liminatans]|uniref:L-2-amino-thiazoline-4-carboxylic acid hydrolase n=1 Tax=Methanofollis liminatans TaxID=2201 RepID=A0A831LQQ5_9EURY|nr:hypothetical protein [Methanofollis liminatans]
MMAKDLIEEIPPMARWRFATRAAALIPALYSCALTGEGGGSPGEREQMIWYAIGREVKDIASTFGLPVDTAEEIAETLRIGAMVLFGPEFRVAVLPSSGETATVVMKGCPFTGTLREAGCDLFAGASWCMPFAISAVEHLNGAFTLRFVRARCMGDGQCEMVVRKREEGE